MHKNEKIIQAITHQGVLPLYFHPEETTSLSIMESLYRAGIRVIEYTNRGRQAMKNFRSLKKSAQKKFPGLMLGMGTVNDLKSASQALKAGADFLVSPGFTSGLARLAKKESILWIPGCFSPTELAEAQAEGLGMVKVFPAQVLGPAFIRSVREVFPDLLFMPTGGVDNDNLEAWFRAGVSAVGMGGSLISRALIEKNDFEKLQTDTALVLKKIVTIRNSLV
jgi:2-dehydro-3-deoxyphosphogluconate aldolase/(4S)-4-hydroxy-2-oxoglutarate aldolase